MQDKLRAAEVFFAGAIATFSLVLSVVSYFQYDAARKAAHRALQANRLTSEALTSVQRAFVMVGAIDMSRQVDAAGHIGGFYLSPVLENTGTTPAIHMYCHASAKVLDDSTKLESFDFPDIWYGGRRYPSGPIALAAKASVESNAIPITVNDMKGAQFGPNQKQLYVWGWVTYRDIFKGTPLRKTEFCKVVAYVSPAVYNPTITGEVPLINYGGCRVHNCTDSDCK